MKIYRPAIRESSPAAVRPALCFQIPAHRSFSTTKGRRHPIAPPRGNLLIAGVAPQSLLGRSRETTRPSQVRSVRVGSMAVGTALLREGRSAVAERSFLTLARPDLSATTKTQGREGCSQNVVIIVYLLVALRPQLLRDRVGAQSSPSFRLCSSLRPSYATRLNP